MPENLLRFHRYVVLACAAETRFELVVDAVGDSIVFNVLEGIPVVSPIAAIISVAGAAVDHLLHR